MKQYDRVERISTGETAIVAEPLMEDCPNIGVIPDADPWRIVCWPRSDVRVVSKATR